jgi:hypothetical protein
VISSRKNELKLDVIPFDKKAYIKQWQEDNRQWTRDYGRKHAVKYEKMRKERIANLSPRDKEIYDQKNRDRNNNRKDYIKQWHKDNRERLKALARKRWSDKTEEEKEAFRVKSRKYARDRYHSKKLKGDSSV